MNKATRIALLGCILMLLTVPLAGCWDQLEIEDRALVLGLALDLAPPGSEDKEEKTTHIKDSDIPGPMLRITAQIAVPGRVPLGPGTGDGGGAGSESPVWVVSALGHTLEDCLSNLQQMIADPGYLIHLRIIAISKEVAAKGMEDINDYLRRNSEVRRRTWLLVTEGEAGDLLKIRPPLQRVPALYLLAMMDKAVTAGKLPGGYMGEFWSSQSMKGQDSYLPYVATSGEDIVIIKGLAYFSGHKLKGTTEPLEIGAFMALQGMDPGGYSYLFHSPDYGVLMTKINERYTRRKTDFKDGKPKMIFNIQLEGDIEEHYNYNKAIRSGEDLKEIQQAMSKQIEEGLSRFVAHMQQDKSDIFGIGECIRGRHPSYWNQKVGSLEKWHDLYQTIEVEINVKIRLRRVGLKVR